MHMKVRFAPSPTGYIHLGNARMATLNYFLAQKLHGDFILRIDDTDTQRVKEEYISSLKEDLQWLGITWVEEFKQSQRLEIYKKFLEELIEKGLAYPCFETQEELQYKKKIQLAKGKPPIYDRAMLNLSSEQHEKYIKEGRKPYYRLKIDHTAISWNDLIKGNITFQGENISDPVVIREDGTYLYILTSVLDDIEKGITHIIRGEDHIVNTAVQIQMFNYLQAPLPTFAHLPLITNNKGEGFSKREGSLALKNLRAEGIIPMAINNYLYALGLGEQNIVYKTIPEIVEVFDLQKYSPSAAKFDVEKLLRINLILLQQEDFSTIYNMCQELLGIKIKEDFWNIIKFNITALPDIKTWYSICYENVGNSTTFNMNKEVLQAASESLANYKEIDETFWPQWSKEIKELSNIKGKELFLTLRIALTGLEKGPEFKDLLPLIGYDKINTRLSNALNTSR